MKTFGEFYREKVLCLPENLLEERELSYYSEELRIEKDLFCWKIVYTKLGRKTGSFIECRSEEEARYLKIFLELNIYDVMVPKDDEYLKTILPELEKMKQRVDEILNFYLESIFSQKYREQLRTGVMIELTK